MLDVPQDLTLLLFKQSNRIRTKITYLMRSQTRSLASLCILYVVQIGYGGPGLFSLSLFDPFLFFAVCAGGEPSRGTLESWS